MNTRRSWETLTHALDQACGPGKSSGHWIRYLCPVHEADGRPHKPSLGVTYDQDQRKTVVRCFAGCSDNDILDSLGLDVRDLFDAPRDPNRLQRNTHHDPNASLAAHAIRAAGLGVVPNKPDLGRAIGHPREAATYIYRWPDGRPEGRVHRVQTQHEHGQDKQFWQEHMTEHGWESGGFARIPYKLPELVQAIAEGEDIYICEGEKDVHTAQHAGLNATCNAGGALSWTPEHAEWLRGARRVRIVTDRDAAGYRRAAKVAESLHGIVDEIRVVQARDGNDLTDHFNAGHQIDELEPVPYLDKYYTTTRGDPPSDRRRRSVTPATRSPSQPMQSSAHLLDVTLPGESTHVVPQHDTTRSQPMRSATLDEQNPARVLDAGL